MKGSVASDFSLELVRPLAAPERDARETELLRRARAGDHDAYASLVRPHERVAFRVAAAITGARPDAEEALQNGLVKAYRSLHRFRAGAAFRPWLVRIVVNEAHNVVRSERRQARLRGRAAERHEAATAPLEETLIARDDAAIVVAALGRLSEADRLALVLRYFAELPDHEAAVLVGTSAQAYRVRLVRARRRLQAELEESDV
jgi:RNA polymerase sigma-70 factor (ECF subfamily)